jgi:transposase DDE domain
MLNLSGRAAQSRAEYSAKILPAAFESLFHHFTDRICEQKTYNGYRLFAVDGSDLQIAANPQDADSFYPGANGQKSYNLLHINAMYDLLQHIYVDAIIQKSRKTDESAALTSMVDRSADKNVLLLADRGYEACNNLAHIQEKGWSFLIRIKDSSAGIASGLNLPRSNTFDIPFHLKLTNKQTNEVKCLLLDKNHYKRIPSKCRFDYLPAKSRKADPTQFFDLHFRIVRFPISETACETIITNLDKDAFPIQEIKHLYAMRWGIETSFRELKYSVTLLHLHSKKVDFIYQEIFAKLIMYNFCQMITQSVVIQQGKKKHAYKVSFSDAVHVCLRFFRGKISPPDVEALLMRYISPIAPAECFLVSSLRNLRSASLIEYHNFLHLHSPFFADFFFRFISFTLFSLKSAHRVFFTDSVCWLSLFTFKDTPHN